jgi:hypothetical protein
MRWPASFYNICAARTRSEDLALQVAQPRDRDIAGRLGAPPLVEGGEDLGHLRGRVTSSIHLGRVSVADMPSRLKVVAGFLALSGALAALGAVFDLVLGQFGSAAFLVVCSGANLLLLLGLSRGSEGTRTWLLAASWAEVLLGVGYVLFGALLFNDGKATGGAVVVFSGAYALVQAGVTIRTLKRPDIMEWMFQRSLGQ